MVLTDGTTLYNRYRIEGQLGQGGMGKVYRAWDDRLRVPVAIKEMSPQPGFTTTQMTPLRDQFMDEARVLARLNHPHLVRVKDFFVVDDTEYLVMDYAEGTDLATRIGQWGPLPEVEVLVWAGQLLDALAYCHTHRVFHRDVKPQNVVIDNEGRAVLVDFGLVKQVEVDDQVTRAGIRGIGTPEYSPPEQGGESEVHTDERSDLYSLGATLYHALTGSAPPTVTQRTSGIKHLDPIHELVSGVSSRTEKVVMKALKLDRELRWQTAQEMADALGVTGPMVLVQNQRETLPPRPDARPRAAAPVTRPRRQTDRRRRRWVGWLAGALALVALFVVLLAGTNLFSGWGDDPETPTPTVVAMATATPEPTATEVPPTATATPEPTATATPTLAPTATATATPTRTPTVEPTVTLVPTPTVIPTDTPAPRRLAAPTLIAPQQGTSFTGWGAQVVLQWTSVGGLNPDEFYVVRIPYNQLGETAEFWRKDTAFDVPDHFSAPNVGFADRHYNWTVQVMRCTKNCAQAADDNVRKSGVAVGEKSTEGLFYWSPDIHSRPTSTPVGGNGSKPTSTPVP
jgi:serine/threonine-protein kinase